MQLRLVFLHTQTHYQNYVSLHLYIKIKFSIETNSVRTTGLIFCLGHVPNIIKNTIFQGNVTETVTSMCVHFAMCPMEYIIKICVDQLPWTF